MIHTVVFLEGAKYGSMSAFNVPRPARCRGLAIAGTVTFLSSVVMGPTVKGYKKFSADANKANHGSSRHCQKPEVAGVASVHVICLLYITSFVSVVVRPTCNNMT
ncbi:hypothetical protein NEOLEDRAFT_35839 [Neolentinus lepideus HHB14362 ss-1]|uniref:Uncharacterized protein n=1 Tax=Neolentinus lepideus HHB14362 ss-1 TaxID=1314782 RepID=A0A165W7K0_9AGAM|nr:hypothetical protein NEOLEDRAFT_35839 [Neolentinus lepideus HHB14362 ss-1]